MFRSILLSALVISFSNIAAAQTFERLTMPKKDRTGGYHGARNAWVGDAVFVNQDDHFVIAINESISLFESKTGKRVNTLLNGQRGGGYGWTVNVLHLVNDGRTLLCDEAGTWVGTAFPESGSYDPARWVLWDIAELIDRPQPRPRFFFSRAGSTRGVVDDQEKRLIFIRQLGEDFLFLHNPSSDPRTIRVFRPGDRINQPRQVISLVFGADAATGHVLERDAWRPQIVCASKPGPIQKQQREFSDLVLWRFTHDEDGQVCLSSEPIESQEPLMRKENFVLHRGDGTAYGTGSGWVGNAYFLLNGTVLPLDGIPSRNSEQLAVSTHGRYIGQGAVRASDPLAVTILDTKSREPLGKLACGEGWCGRPIAFSSDGSMLITSSERNRVMSVPDVRLWHLKGRDRVYPKRPGAPSLETTVP